MMMIRKFLPAVLALAAVPTAIALLLTLAPSRADAQQRSAPLCPATMPAGAPEVECECPATSEGSVWGTDHYTDDSNLCRAAVHAGAIPATGGMIRARAMPGRDYYTGSQRNGVASNNYGSWSRTVVFDGTRTIADGTDGIALCPGTYDGSGRGWSGTCRCPAVIDAPVWGSNPYTTDSNLCRAAVHAGAIGATGGVVRVTSAAGQGSYAGSSRNGVTTSDWGSYPASFRVSAAKD